MGSMLQVRNATQVETIAQAMLDLEKHLRRTALKPEWDPLAAREVTTAAARPSGPEKPAPGNSGQPSTPAPLQKAASEPASRQQTPGPAGADAGISRVAPIILPLMSIAHSVRHAGMLSTGLDNVQLDSSAYGAVHDRQLKGQCPGLDNCKCTSASALEG